MTRVVIDERARNLKAEQMVAFALVFPLWACVALTAWRNYEPLGGVVSFGLLLTFAIICTVVIFAAGYFGQLLDYLENSRLEEAIRSRGGEVNCHTRAEQYVREYQNARMHPFTGDEEEALINYLMERFGVFEDTAAEIVAANWPLHRSGLKYRGLGDNAAIRRAT